MSEITANSPQTTSTWYNPVRATTQLRHHLVIQKFNELMSMRVGGMRPNMEDALLQTSTLTGYSKKTIENILSRNRNS